MDIISFSKANNAKNSIADMVQQENQAYPQTKQMTGLYKKQIIWLEATNKLWIDEANPTVCTNTGVPLEFKPTIGSRRRAMLKFDLSPLVGKQIYSAYIKLKMMVSYSNTPNITVARSKTNWSNATWNTYNGTNAWQTIGGLGLNDEEANVASLAVFRPSQFHDCYRIDISTIAQNWANGSYPNYGVALSCDQTITALMSSSWDANTKIYLEVVYADKPSFEVFPNSTKYEHAFYALGQNTFGILYWDFAMGKNAQANAMKLGFDYQNSLESFLSKYIATNGTIQNMTINTTFIMSMGQTIYDMYIKTSNSKYLTVLETFKTYIDARPKSSEGITLEDGSIISENGYCIYAFLCAYDALKNDDSSNGAMQQSVLLYNKLLVGQSDKVPLTDTARPLSKGWSRGIGWLVGGYGKMLNYPIIKNQIHYAEFIAMYKELIDTIISYQDISGLWRSKIQEVTYPVETSGSALIALGIECGIQAGVLPITYRKYVDKALVGLLNQTITGSDLHSCFPQNINGDYSITNFGVFEHGFGSWMELVTTVLKR